MERHQLSTRIFDRAMRMRRGVRISSEKSSPKTLTGNAGRAVPMATRPVGCGRARFTATMR